MTRSLVCALVALCLLLTACAGPVEPTPASSQAETAPPISGAYYLAYSDRGEDDPAGMRLELLQKGDELGLLFTAVYDDRECAVQTCTVPAVRDGSGAVAVTYDGGSEHIELTCDGRTAEVVFLWEGERDPAGGTYERIDVAETPSLPPAVPQPENDPLSPNGAVDRILAAAARRDLEYPDDAALSRADCARVRSIQIFEDRLTSLNGIEYFTNLENVEVNSSYLTDVTPLTRLKKLRSVSISWSYITGIPDFSGCPDLELLSFVCCRITDLSPAARIPSLKTLQLSDNAVTSVAPLAGVEGLQALSLEGNPILDWETVAGNASLRAAVDLDFDAILATLERARAIVSETVAPGMTDLEKEIALCRKIHAIADYQEIQRPQRPYGYEVLINGRGVCGDFAEATCLLMNLAGIPCVDLVSDTHAWNAVRIGGAWYELDCLWDDGVQPVYWQYFNLSRGKMSRDPDHVSDANRFPFAEVSMPRLEYLMLIDDPYEFD